MKKEMIHHIRKIQRNELLEHLIYKKISDKTKNKSNKKILRNIAQDELKHYKFWKSITKEEIKPPIFIINFYSFLATILGTSFTLKFMERKRHNNKALYNLISKRYKKSSVIQKQKHNHEQKLLSLIDEDRLSYAGSMVLGINDALVELSGALAGLTFALQNTHLIAVVGMITGLAAALSMAASGYLSSREEINQNKKKKPLKAALYTGLNYILTVILLVLPYMLFNNIYFALLTMLIIVLLIISSYTFYISTAKSLRFWNRFKEMSLLSLSVAFISFVFGIIIRDLFGVS